jgi:hypothetical protein
MSAPVMPTSEFGAWQDSRPSVRGRDGRAASSGARSGLGDRLIGFLDKTDNYVSRELEDSIDDNPHDEETDDNGEDNEDADPAEPPR